MAARLLTSVPEDRRTECWWIVRRDGTPVSGKAGGGVVLLTQIRLTRGLGLLLGACGLSSLIDRVDTVVSGHRGRLSRFVPDGPAPRRYP